MTKPSHPPRWRKLLEPDMLVALSAIVLGVSALAVSVVQVRIMRQEQHASVWPRLQIGRVYSEGRDFAIVVGNPGIGPAVIKEVTVEVDGRPVTSWIDAINALVPDQPPGDVVFMQVSGRILPAGESIQPIASADPRFADAFVAASSRMRMRVCYCSVYDICWRVAYSGGGVPEPEPVARCVQGASSFRD